MSVLHGEHKGPEANMVTQQVDLNELRADYDDAEEGTDLSEFDFDKIDVNAAEQARLDQGVEKRPLQDIGKERAAALGQKLSSAKKSAGSLFGGLMSKLGSAAKGLAFGALSAPEAAGRAGVATKDAVVDATKAAGRAIDHGISATAKPVIEAGSAFGKGAAKVGEKALAGVAHAVESGEEAMFRGIEKGVGGIVKTVQGTVEGAKSAGRGLKTAGEVGLAVGLMAGQAGIEGAKKAWGGLLERGRGMVDSLSERKNKAVEGFLGWRVSRLEKKAEIYLKKAMEAGGASTERRNQLEGLRVRAQEQRHTLEALSTVQVETPDVSEAVAA